MGKKIKKYDYIFIKDYTNALTIKPGDIKIKENIEKLKALQN